MEASLEPGPHARACLLPATVFGLALFAVVVSGCDFTHQVRFSPTPAVELPTAGPRTMVEVIDERPERLHTLLGTLMAASVSDEHTFVLAGEDSFAGRFWRDLVAALRARGYRAQQRPGATVSPADDDIVLTIRIVKHAIDMEIFGGAVFLVGASLFECRATAGTSQEAAWSETIEHS